MANVIARYRSQEHYDDSDWVERDNFDSKDQAISYVKMNMSRFGKTPYRIIEQDDRFIVEFVPEWKLKKGE